jgi:hypothetical protein
VFVWFILIFCTSISVKAFLFIDCSFGCLVAFLLNAGTGGDAGNRKG